MNVHSAAASRNMRHSDRASEVVDHALDARGHNLHQARLIANRTPDVDCLLDHLHELIRTASPEQRDHLAAMLGILRTLGKSNAQEGELEQAVAGAAEQMALDARDRRMRDYLGVKAIANAVRGPLGVLAHPQRHTASEYVHAARTLDDVIARVPAEQLVRASVRHELGVRKYGQLVALVHDREAVAA